MAHKVSEMSRYAERARGPASTSAPPQLKQQRPAETMRAGTGTGPGMLTGRYGVSSRLGPD